MDHAGEARLRAGFNCNAGARNGRCCRNTAEKRREQIAHALRNRLAVTVQRNTRHARSTGTAQKAFNHTQRRNADCRGQQCLYFVKIQPGKAEALRQ